VRNTWEDVQASRERNAIYGYLTAVYGLVGWWTAEGREVDRARRALRLQRLEISDREDPFASVIRCTADPAKASAQSVLCRLSVRRHHSEIVLGVLVVVLRPDDISRPGFLLG
jgi:hypothetical protein